MAIFKFEKVYEKRWYTEIEADSFEEAKEELPDAEWEEDDGGESYMTNSYAYEVDEDDDVIEEFDWEPY